VEAGNQEDGFERQLVWLDVGSWRPGRCEEVGETFDGKSGIGRLVDVSTCIFICDLHSVLGCKMSHLEKRQKKLTFVVSMVRGMMSGREKDLTAASSSVALQTMKTMNPRLSISRASVLVSGSRGDPAITMTSLRPPFLLRLALRTFRTYLFCW
jgi:hypothetical protein